MKNNEKPFSIRIDWSDQDVFGHVNNVVYFKYIQAARVNYCESIGLTSSNEKDKWSFIVASTSCKFKKSLEFPGTIQIKSEVEWVKNSSFQLNHIIYNEKGEIVAEASDVLLVYDYEFKIKVRISEELRLKMLEE